MSLPTQVKVGPIIYEVIEDETLREKQLYGSIRFLESIIAILPDLPPVLQRIKLVHELIHAIKVDAGFDEHDERMVDALAFRLVQVVQDNPELAEYLCHEVDSRSGLNKLSSAVTK